MLKLDLNKYDKPIKTAAELGMDFTPMIREQFADGEVYHAFPEDILHHVPLAAKKTIRGMFMVLPGIS